MIHAIESGHTATDSKQRTPGTRSVMSTESDRASLAIRKNRRIYMVHKVRHDLDHLNPLDIWGTPDHVKRRTETQRKSRQDQAHSHRPDSHLLSHAVRTVRSRSLQRFRPATRGNSERLGFGEDLAVPQTCTVYMKPVVLVAFVSVHSIQESTTNTNLV